METRPRILIVDDHPDGREMLAVYLGFHGFPVSEARDGQEAMELAASFRPDIILMDLQMPRMDGWEVTRRLKADPQTAGVLVVALTAHALEREVQSALAAGCSAVISKPCPLEGLVQALMRTPDLGPAAFDGPDFVMSAPSEDDP